MEPTAATGTTLLKSRRSVSLGWPRRSVGANLSSFFSCHLAGVHGGVHHARRRALAIHLTRALLEKGYSATDIRNIYSGNLLRVMHGVEAAAGK